MKKVLLTLSILFVSFVLGVAVVIQTDPFKKRVTEYISHAVEQKTGYSFCMEGWKFRFPCHLRAKKIALTKGDETLVSLSQVKCSLNLYSLLSGQLKISSLSIEEMHLAAPPLPPSSKGTTRQLEVDNLRIAQLHLAALNTTVSLEGSGAWDSLKNSLDAKLCIDEIPVILSCQKNKETWFFNCQHKSTSLKGSLHCDEQSTLHFDIQNPQYHLNGNAEIDNDYNIKSSSFSAHGLNTDLTGRIVGSLFDLQSKIQFTHSQMGSGEIVCSCKKQEDGFLTTTTLTSPQAGSIHLQSLISTSRKLWPYHITYDNEWAHLVSDGRFRAAPDTIVLSIDECQGTYYHYPFSLCEPVMIRNAECSPLFLQFAGGTIYSTLDLHKNHVHTTTRARDLPSELFETLMPPLPFDSTVSIDAFLFGSPDSLKGQIQVDLDRLKIHDESFAKFPPLNASCRATIKDDTLECVGTIIGASPQPLSFTGSLPFHCQLLPPKIEINPHQPMQAQLTASLEITSLLQLIYTETTHITGKTAISLEVNGTLASPQLSGQMTLENGTFESFRFGTVFENINAKIVGRGSEAILTHFSATSAGNTALTAKGKITLDPRQNFPFDLSLTTRRAPLLNLDTASVLASGPIQIKGNSKNADLTGQLLIDKADFTLPKQLSPSIKHIDVSYINQPDNEESPTLYQQKVDTWPMTLNVDLRAPKGLTVSGRDLNSEWKGNASIKGTTSAPQIFGQIEAISGEQLLNGKMFQLAQGNITFNGDYSEKATLYVVVEHELEECNAEIVLKGAVNNPSISFRSNPPMSQQEILSLILFNKPLPEIDALQGSQLSQSFSALSAEDDSANFLGKLRNSVKIDSFGVNVSDDDDQKDISITVGKYVTPRLFVSVNKSMTSEATSVAVAANLIKSLKLQAEVDEGANSQLMLKWKYDY